MPRPGRKSKAEQRRREILAAFARCIGRHGLAESSVARVAEEAGLQRTLVFHYFGDRQALIDALIDYEVEFHEQALSESLAGVGPGERLERLLDYFFGGGFYARFPESGQVWLELVGIASRDPRLRSRLVTLWRRWLAEVDEWLADAYPGAPAERRAAIAFGLTCLAEQSFSMGLQGLEESRHALARASAEALLATLH